MYNYKNIQYKRLHDTYIGIVNASKKLIRFFFYSTYIINYTDFPRKTLPPSKCTIFFKNLQR